VYTYKEFHESIKEMCWLYAKRSRIDETRCALWSWVMWGKERGLTKWLEWCRVHEILDFKVLAFRHLIAPFQGSCNHEIAFCYLQAAFQGLPTTSSHFAIFEQHFKVKKYSPTTICSNMACMTILARSNEFASKWPRFSSRTD